MWWPQSGHPAGAKDPCFRIVQERLADCDPAGQNISRLYRAKKLRHQFTHCCYFREIGSSNYPKVLPQ